MSYTSTSVILLYAIHYDTRIYDLVYSDHTLNPWGQDRIKFLYVLAYWPSILGAILFTAIYPPHVMLFHKVEFTLGTYKVPMLSASLDMLCVIQV